MLRLNLFERVCVCVCDRRSSYYTLQEKSTQGRREKCLRASKTVITHTGTHKGLASQDQAARVAQPA